jgi:hypothetical protein
MGKIAMFLCILALKEGLYYGTSNHYLRWSFRLSSQSSIGYALIKEVDYNV